MYTVKSRIEAILSCFIGCAAAKSSEFGVCRRWLNAVGRPQRVRPMSHVRFFPAILSREVAACDFVA